MDERSHRREKATFAKAQELLICLIQKSAGVAHRVKTCQKVCTYRLPLRVGLLKVFAGCERANNFMNLRDSQVEGAYVQRCVHNNGFLPLSGCRAEISVVKSVAGEINSGGSAGWA